MSIEVSMTRTGYSLWTRTTLALSPLVIDGNPYTGSYHLTEEDLAWPAFQVRRSLVPPSKDIGGQYLDASAIEEGTIGLKIAAHGDTMTETWAAMQALMACTSQVAYSLTLTVGGVEIGTYAAKPELPLWGAMDSGMVRAALNEAVITIPINPPGGA